MFEGNASPDRIVVEDDTGVLPLTECRLSADARPADLKVSARSKGTAVIETQSKLCHQWRHFLAEIKVETNIFDPELLDVQIELAGVFEKDGAFRKPDRRATEFEIHVVHA